jgi:hypothetical protein
VSNLTTPASVQKLQMALHDKAKESPNLRFYALYDKVYRQDVLAFAHACCKANGGAAGVGKAEPINHFLCGASIYRSRTGNSGRSECPPSGIG